MMKHKGTATLQTERLILRRYAIGDAGDMYRNWAASEAVTRFLTWEPYRSIEDVRGYIQFCIDSYTDDTYAWVIVDRATGEAIGSISVVGIDELTRCAEIGYCIGEAYWGRGVTAEALRRVIEYLFEEVGCNRIEATHDVNNPNSGRVMEKCGMRYEGTLRQAGVNNRGICDKAVRAILREDYLAQKKKE